MLFYLGFMAFLVFAIINHRKLFKKDKIVFVIYLLSIVFTIFYFIYMNSPLLFGTAPHCIINLISKFLPIIIIFLTAFSLRRKRND